jgi:hypothetical protein
MRIYADLTWKSVSLNYPRISAKSALSAFYQNDFSDMFLDMTTGGNSDYGNFTKETLRAIGSHSIMKMRRELQARCLRSQGLFS